MIYVRYTDIPGLYDVFDAALNPLASELTARQLVDFARRCGEPFKIVPPPEGERLVAVAGYPGVRTGFCKNCSNYPCTCAGERLEIEES